MLGITFKENCPDVRNTNIIDVVAALTDYGIKVTIYDPWANPAEVEHEYGLTTVNGLPVQKFDAVVLGVAHKEFQILDYKKLQNDNAVLYDVKGVLPNITDGKL